MADLGKIGDILVLLGGIVGIIEGILTFLGTPIFSAGGLFLDGWIMGILGILFALIALVNSGFLKISALDFGKKNKFLVCLIIGVIMIVFASTLGGILVVIGAILWLL